MFRRGAQPEHTTVNLRPSASIPSSNLLCLPDAQAPAKLKRFLFLPRQTATRPSWCLNTATKSAKTLHDLLSFSLAAWSVLLQRAIGWGHLTFPSFLEELEILGLKGKFSGPNEYAHALAAYLGIQIAVEIVDDAEDPRSDRKSVV